MFFVAANVVKLNHLMGNKIYLDNKLSKDNKIGGIIWPLSTIDHSNW